MRGRAVRAQPLPLAPAAPVASRRASPCQAYKSLFEKLIIEEAVAQIMQGSESADLIQPYPTVLQSSQQARSGRLTFGVHRPARNLQRTAPRTRA